MSQNEVMSLTDDAAKRMRLIAKEIAADIIPIETILKSNNVAPDQWETLQNNTYFQTILEEEQARWLSVPNTSERIKAKYLSMVEEAAESMFSILVDPKESANARNEVLKTVSRIAGLGVAQASDGAAGDRISIKINMGNDIQLDVEKAVRVIEHQAAE